VDENVWGGATPWITRSQSNKGAWSALEKIEVERGREDPRPVGPGWPASPLLKPPGAPLRQASRSVDATLFGSLIGSLRYVIHTRPDLSFGVGYLSRFMEEPKQEHMAAMKHLLRYVAGTLEFGLCYRSNNADLNLVGYSDSDMAGDVDDRKSTSGVIFFLGGNPVTWFSQKQRVVALSSCEAEYIAGAGAACQAVWLRRLIRDLLDVKLSPPLIKMDNMYVIALSKNPMLHDRSKHIDTKSHFIRECVEKGDIAHKFRKHSGSACKPFHQVTGKGKISGTSVAHWSD
jgi:hypothetical protein